jgi:hypothetical protein
MLLLRIPVGTTKRGKDYLSTKKEVEKASIMKILTG